MKKLGLFLIILSLTGISHVFAADDPPVFTDADLNKYKYQSDESNYRYNQQVKYPSDRRESDADLMHQKDKTGSADSKIIDQELPPPENSLSSPAKEKRAYSEISAILYKTST